MGCVMGRGSLSGIQIQPRTSFPNYICSSFSIKYRACVYRMFNSRADIYNKRTCRKRTFSDVSADDISVLFSRGERINMFILKCHLNLHPQNNRTHNTEKQEN